MERHRRAAPVGGGAGRLQLGDRLAAREALRQGLAIARHLDDQLVGQRIHHRDADAVQAARRRIDLAVELAAGMQRGEDDFERRLVLELGMRVDGNAAAIVAHQHAVAAQHLEIDRVGVARDRLVHGVVEHLGHEMMQGPLVGAADIHGGALADGLQPLQHLDVAGGVGIVLGRCGTLAARPIEQIAVFGHGCFLSFFGRARGSLGGRYDMGMVGKSLEINHIRWGFDGRKPPRPDHQDRAAARRHERQWRYFRRLGALPDGRRGRRPGGPGGQRPRRHCGDHGHDLRRADQGRRHGLDLWRGDEDRPDARSPSPWKPSCSVATATPTSASPTAPSCSWRSTNDGKPRAVPQEATA